MLAQNVSETNNMPNIDFRVFWINVRYKLLIPFVIGFLIAVGTHYATKTMIPNKWEASTYVIRHAKNIAKNANIPYLYLETDLTTVSETILLRDHLITVINNLNLNVDPEDLRRSIQIDKGKKSKVIKITATSSEPELAVKIADELGVTFLSGYASVQNAAARKIHSYYETKFSTSKERLYQLQLNEKTFRDNNNILDFDAQKANLYKAISDLELRLMDEEIRIADLKSKRTEIERKLSNTKNTTLISEIVRTNENTLTQKLRSELEVLRKRYTDANPKIQHLLHKISVLEKEATYQSTSSNGGIVDERKFGYNPVYGELQLLKIELDADILAAEGNVGTYQDSINGKKEELNKLSKLEQRHFQLKHSIDTQRDLINNLSNRVIESSIALESNISDFDILEYAQLPEYPKRSFRKIITIAVAILVVIFITVIILLREFIDNSMKTATDLEKLTGLSFTAVLPNKDEVTKSTFYSQFHLFYSALCNAKSAKSGKLLTVSSLSEGEGKSFICNELIEQLNHQGKRVLYIESIQAGMNPATNSLINNPLLDCKTIADFKPQALGELYSKAYYEVSDNMYLDILNTTQISDFISRLDADYDMIIWELFQPNIHLQLFRSISESAASNLVVAKSCSTPKSEMERFTSLIQEWKVSDASLLLNALPCKYIRKTI